MRRGKYICKFLGLRGTYVRVCTRTRRDVWKYCFKQVLSTRGVLFFRIRKVG